MNAYTKLRAEAALSGRFLPLRIYILLIESALSIGLLAFTAPGLLTHYSGIVGGYPLLSKFGILMPEFVALALVAISIFCGYAKTSKIAFRRHVYLVIILVVHGAAIYGVAFMERRADRQIQDEIEHRKRIAEEQSLNALATAKGNAEIQSEQTKQQVADIRQEARRRAMFLSTQGHMTAASRVLNAAEARVENLYKSRAVAAPTSSAIANLDLTQIQEKMAADWVGRKLERIRRPVVLYLSTPIGFILPIICAFFFLVTTMKRWKEEGGHEMAAGGAIREPSTSQAYEVPGSKALPGWKPARPHLREFDVDSTAHLEPGDGQGK